MTEVWTGFEAMTAGECRRLLASTDIGRLALTAGALPLVLPVHCTIIDDHLLLRTPGHHAVSPGIDGQVVGFEADELDLDHGTGWCVAVTGMVRIVTDPPVASTLSRWFSDGLALSMATDVVVGHRVVV